MFLYFVGGRNAQVPDYVRGVLGSSVVSRDVPGTGPHGTSGTLFAAAAAATSTAFGVFEGQHWESFGPDGVAIGWDELPTPEELAKPKQLLGHSVTMADGSAWLVPIARQFVGDEMGPRWEVQLPRVLKLNEANQWVFDGINQRYQALWDTACRWWTECTAAAKQGEDEQQTGLPFAEAVNMACLALGHNYYLGAREASALGILDETTVRDVLNALCDMPAANAWLKKKAQATLGE